MDQAVTNNQKTPWLASISQFHLRILGNVFTSGNIADSMLQGTEGWVLWSKFQGLFTWRNVKDLRRVFFLGGKILTFIA